MKIMNKTSKQSTPQTTVNVYNNIPTYHYNTMNHLHNGDPILAEDS
jgi:hypothetical protein